MQCPQCRHANDGHYMFCLGCGFRLHVEPVPAGEPGGGAPQGNAPQMPRTPSGPRCGQCGNSRMVQGALGPAMGVRVFTPGRHDDVPLASAWVCVDCGHVAMFLPEDARRYLAGLVGR
jgi:hypothetical protein